MNMPATVPIVIKPEAAARVAELGMQAELEKILQHTLRTLPGLRSVEIQWEDYHTGEEPSVTIDALIAQPPGTAPAIEREWDAWFVRSFPPDVCRHFCLLCGYEAADGR